LVLHFLFFPCLQFAYFDRDDVALKGFAKFFKESAEEENEHAQMFIKYQNLRGGRVLLTVVNAPTQQEWDTPLAAVEFALNLEKQVNQVVIYIFQVS
jgi:ferritin heavy chain